MLTAAQICLLASQEAKGGTGMIAIAGQYLNLVLQDLVLNRDLKVNRVTQSVTVATGTNGPFALESDYLRTYDMFYPLQGPNGMTQFLVPITMEQYDAEFKATQTANYPYEFATDLSTQAQTPAPAVPGVITSITPLNRSGGYLSKPAVVIADASGGVGAAATASLTAIGVGIDSAGSGYSEGDILTAIGGVFTRPLMFQWLSSGQIRQVIDGGAYSVVPGNPSVLAGFYTETGLSGTIPVSGGTGANLKIKVIWGLGDVTVNSGGVNYSPGTTVVFPVGGVSEVPPNVDGSYAFTLGPSANVGSAGNFFIYPQSNGQLVLTHRYMRNQPDIVTPETSSVVPWFPYQDYLVKMTAARMMGATGDDRQSAYLAECENMLRPHLIMEGDEQQTVQAVRLDPRTFKSNRGLRPTKLNPY